MKMCQYCGKDLPEDSNFCMFCGKTLEKVENKKAKKGKKSQSINETGLKPNNRKNSFAKVGLALFFIAVIVFDFVLSTVFKGIGWNYKIIFQISTVFYVAALLCGVASMYVDHQFKKKGYEATGNTAYAFAVTIMSFYMLLINVTQVLMK